ncbi:MAG TPA: DUF2017 family protein [Candidatus Micrarchaeia archaeon]|nr:DUF2017 family protein [Candidatus Micrarchaeia archaeon]
MAVIRARGDGHEGAELELGPSEREALANLVDQLEPLAASSPRVSPAAYPDAEQLEAEYRRLTGPDLEAARSAALATVRRALQETGPVSCLGRSEVEAWLRACNALRVALAGEIGIHDDGWEDRLVPSDHARPPYAALHALGWIQQELLAVSPVD